METVEQVREALVVELMRANGHRATSEDMARRIETGELELPRVHANEAHMLAKALRGLAVLAPLVPHAIQGNPRISKGGIRMLAAAAQARGDLATVDLCEEALAGSEMARAECERLLDAALAGDE